MSHYPLALSRWETSSAHLGVGRQRHADSRYRASSAAITAFATPAVPSGPPNSQGLMPVA